MTHHSATPVEHGPRAAPTCHRITDGSTLLGYISIDSTVNGRARGGLRLVADLTEEELRDAARAMTLKYGLLGLPQGGAKAGVIGNPDATPAERRRRLETFGRLSLALLRDRRFVPDADLGTGAADIRSMMQSLDLPVQRRDWRGSRSGDYTAHSCLAAADVLVARLGLSWSNCRVAIEGFGKVGAAAARLVDERGGRVVAVSTAHGALRHVDRLDVRSLTVKAAAEGSRFVLAEPDVLPRSALFDIPADVLLPCARRHSIHGDNVGSLSVRAISAGANNPLTPDAEIVLHGRGVLSVPDFVSNCGGVLGGTLEFAGVPGRRIEAAIDEPVKRWAARFLDEADRRGVCPRAVAEAEALARHAEVRTAAEHPGLVQRVVALGLEAYRREWIPERLMGVVAPRFLARGWR